MVPVEAGKPVCKNELHLRNSVAEGARSSHFPTLLSPKNVASWFKLLGRKLSELVSELLYIKDSSLSSIYIKFLQIKLNFNALGIIAIQFLF